jgi:drug/metabolite transporter (DMT)-like permease
MYYLPILGAMALGAGTIMERLVLKKKHVNIKLYQTAIFLALVVAMLPFIWFFWRTDAAAFTFTNMLILLGVMALSIIANLFVFYSLKWEKINHIEPARMLEPLFTILLALVFSYFFGTALYDRNFKIIIAAVIAGVALVLSHIKKDHLNFNKYFIAAIFGSFFFASELVVSRLILDFYSPIAFYFLRCLGVFLISYAIFRPHFSELDNKLKWRIFITGAIFVIFRVIIYYGYTTLGIISTTLIVMLGPVFIYLFAWKFLNEKLKWRNIAAAAIILAAVLYGMFG